MPLYHQNPLSLSLSLVFPRSFFFLACLRERFFLYPQAAAFDIDGWKKTIFASICNSLVFSSLSLFAVYFSPQSASSRGEKKEEEKEEEKKENIFVCVRLTQRTIRNLIILAFFLLLRLPLSLSRFSSSMVLLQKNIC